METWGYCQSCDRWFYCPSGHDSVTCPVCAEAPARIEHRANAEAAVD